MSDDEVKRSKKVHLGERKIVKPKPPVKGKFDRLPKSITEFQTTGPDASEISLDISFPSGLIKVQTEEEYWTTKDGRKILISDLSDSQLSAIISFVLTANFFPLPIRKKIWNDIKFIIRLAPVLPDSTLVLYLQNWFNQLSNLSKIPFPAILKNLITEAIRRRIS